MVVANVDKFLLQLVLDGLEGLDALLLGLVGRGKVDGLSGCLSIVSLSFPAHCQNERPTIVDVKC